MLSVALPMPTISRTPKGQTFSLKLSSLIMVTASGFFISLPSFANILQKLTPMLTDIPNSSFIRFLISLAISSPDPKRWVDPVTSR